VSKAFTKDDAADDPVVVPMRPPLPVGATNYVTPRGLASLREEQERRGAEISALEAEARDPERTRVLAVARARLREIDERIASAVVVDPRTQPRDAARFGASVTVRGDTGARRRYEIVGVDEADASRGRVAFVAPVARVLLGKRVGDVATLRTPRGDEEIEIVAIEYEGGEDE
jgi:transcription elongation factor GreB